MGEIARPSSDDVCQEAARQRVVEGWTVEHDLQHANGELVRAALTYITGDESWWPWDNRPKFGPRDLIKAGGLLLAEDKRREVAERRDEGKGNAVPFQSPAEIESLHRAIEALRDAHHIPYVDEDHQGGNCADIVMGLIGRAVRAERAAAQAEASRRDWAAEALAMTMAPVRAGELRQDDPYRPPVEGEVPCACISDDQAASLGPGFSRPVCAVHPTPSDLTCPDPWGPVYHDDPEVS